MSRRRKPFRRGSARVRYSKPAVSRTTRLLVLDRDRWTCMMPYCWHPCARTINRSLEGVGDVWSPTVDHILKAVNGGTDGEENLRAAHRLCNNTDRQRDAPLWLQKEIENMGLTLDDFWQAMTGKTILHRQR